MSVQPLAIWDWFVSWIVPFALVFGTIVLVHELGHFLVARSVGVKVHEFAIGFGKVIFRRKRGETVYSLRLFPLGGFVKMAGMDAAVEPGEETEDADERNFHNKALWQRMLTIAAGPLANIVFAIVLLFVFHAFVMVPFAVADVLPDSPAAAAGVMPGDRIVSVQGEPVSDLAGLSGVLGQHPNETVDLVVERSGERLTLPVHAQKNEETGQVLIGVTVMAGGLSGKERMPFGRAVVQATKDTAGWTVDLLGFLGGIVTGQTPAQEVRENVAGPIGIVQSLGETARMGWGYLLLFAAVLNVNLALINLLPVPVLDGGWLVFLLIEGIRGEPLKPEHQGMAQFVGLALLLALMVFVFYLDITRLFA